MWKHVESDGFHAIQIVQEKLYFTFIPSLEFQHAPYLFHSCKINQKIKSCGKTCIDRRSVICSLAQNRITRPGFER